MTKLRTTARRAFARPFARCATRARHSSLSVCCALCLLTAAGVAPYAWADEATDDMPMPAADAAEPTSADDSADAAQERQPAAAIEEITITARKREESLQDTPISVSAFSSIDLIDSGVTRADDVGRLTPNMQFEQSAGDQNTARIQIRGIGNNDPIPTRDPGVGLYLDGVYLARAQGGLLGVVDIERVEVLRGPQGTLFGRNTIGGAVNIVTKKPSDEFEANARIRIGNYNLFESRTMVNVPLIPEKAALRASFQTTTRDGFTKNRLLGQETDDRRLLAGRVALRLNPVDTVEIVLAGEQSRSHEAGRGGECRSTPENLGIAPLIAGLETTDVPLPGGGSLDLFTPVANCMASEADDELDFTSGVRSKSNLDTYGLSSSVTWDLEPVTFKAVTSWRRQEVAFNQDFTYAASTQPTTLGQGIIGNVIQQKSQFDQVGQEFNLSGVAMDGRLQWTTGLFGFYEKTTPGLTQQLVGFDFCNVTTGAALQAMGTPMAQQAVAAAAAVCGGSSLQRGPKLSTLALAGYGQLSYDISPRLHFTGGLRYSAERKDFSFRQRNFVSGNVNVPLPDGSMLLIPAQTIDALPNFGKTSERFGKWTPLLSLAYDVSDDALVYATYSRGFKSGGFNGRPNANIPESLLPFEQEVLDNYEVGLKATWLDSRLVTNVSLFYGQYDDIQQTILAAGPAGDFASRVANAGEAVVRGAEIEMRALPTPGLDLRVGLGFTDAEYREFDDVIEGPVVNGMRTSLPISRRNEEFFNTPSFTANLSAAYTFVGVGPLGDVTTRLAWYHQDEVNFGPSSDTLEQGKYGLLSGQITFALPDGKTEIAVFGENLLDRRYINSGINFERGFASSLAYYGAPRMYGVEIRRDF